MQIERPIFFRVHKNNLEGGIVRARGELTIHPLDALLRIVFWVSKKVIQFPTA